jgi:large subunit ribosomal protein L35
MVPKVKTHKGAAKRFQFSGSGKVMRTRHMKSHLRRNKSARTKREFDEMLVVAPADQKRIARLIPYGTGK